MTHSSPNYCSHYPLIILLIPSMSKAYRHVNLSQGFPLTKHPLGQPLHFGGEVPQFPSLPNGPSLKPFETEKIDKSDESAVKEVVKIASEDKALEVLKGDYWLSTSVKSSSPNCKRVSPPQCDFETSPTWRNCRKLILRSIPSFSTLTPEKKSMELEGKLE